MRAVSGLPRRCEADAWEEEQRASEQSREERSGLQNLLRCDESAGSTARDGGALSNIYVGDATERVSSIGFLP